MKRRGRKYLVLGALVALSALEAGALDTLLVGEGGRPWSDGGGGLDPPFLLDDGEVAVGNRPGNVVDYELDPGWVFPRSIDNSVNLARGSAERGGGADSPLPSIHEDEMAFVVDGEAHTAFRRKAEAGQLLQVLGIIIDLDLGARFGVNRVRFFPRNSVYESPDYPFETDFIRGYEISLNDGSEATQVGGRPVFSSFKREPDNTEAVVDLEVPLQFVRYIRLTTLTTVGFEVDEIEVYGAGFVPEGTYLSDIYDVGTPANWGRLWWTERKDGVAGLSDLKVVTRSGRDASPLVYTRKLQGGLEVPWRAGARTGGIDLDASTGEVALDAFNRLPPEERSSLELTLEEYEALGSGERGTVRSDRINWSPWTAAYSQEGKTAGGTPVVSPGPRRYFQFRLDFASSDVESATGVDALGFELSAPAPALNVVGEIHPRQIRAGQSTDFLYGVRAQMGPDNPGFDRFEVFTAAPVDAIRRIEVVDEEGDLVAGEEFGTLDRLQLPAEQGGFSIQAVESDRFVIGFPAVTADGAGLRIRFTSSALRFGQTFEGRAFSSDRPGELAQLVVPGNAGQLTEEDIDARPPGTEDGTAVDNSLSVRMDLGGSFLGRVRSEPAVFTPNGDGVNDRVDFEIQVFRLGLEAPLRFEVYDLGGRLRATPFDGERASGQFTAAWDGKDGAGGLVEPGIYLVRAVLETDAGTKASSGLVSIAY